MLNVAGLNPFVHVIISCRCYYRYTRNLWTLKQLGTWRGWQIKA